MHNKTVLPNGVRIVSEHMDGVRSSAIGIWVGVGSRHEAPGEEGSAHYIEHMLFKGTSRHTASELAEIMDSLGGQINAYTTRDNTCFHARVLDSRLPEAIDVLSDMFFDSLFAEDDVKSERGIIFEEIDMYEDTPEDVTVEQLLKASFPGPLGLPVLGSKESLAGQTGAGLRKFMAANYVAPRVVISLAGSFSDTDIEHISRRFSGLSGAQPGDFAASAYAPSFTVREKSTEQNHISLGFPGVSVCSADRFAMSLMSGILGGNASSRLFQTVREKHGLCYSIFSFSASFSETGLLGVSVAMSADTEARAMELIMEELRKMRDGGVTADELDRAREQSKASLLMSLESTASRMNRIGSGELYRGEAMPADEAIARYDAVTRDDILRIARETLDLEKISLSAVGRVKDEAQYRELLK